MLYHKEFISHNSPLDEPEEVTRETSEYIESNNPVLEWLSSNYEKTNKYDDKITVDEMYSDFTVVHGGIPKKRFGEYMKMAGYQSFVSNGSRVYRCVKRKLPNFVEEDRI